MSRKHRSRLNVLRKRAAFLRRRIAEHPEKDLTFDLEEAAALEWAVAVLSPQFDPQDDTQAVGAVK